MPDRRTEPTEVLLGTGLWIVDTLVTVDQETTEVTDVLPGKGW